MENPMDPRRYMTPSPWGTPQDPIVVKFARDGKPVELTVTKLQAAMIAVLHFCPAPRHGSGVEALAEILIEKGWSVSVLDVTLKGVA